MTAYLVSISLLLHAVSFFAIILLLQKQNQLKKTEQNVKQMIHETENMMTAFVMEIKEENESLIQQLSNERGKAEKPRAPKVLSSAADEGELEAVTSITPRQTVVHAYTAQQIKQEKPENPAKPKPLSLNEQIVQMNLQGMSEEEIARALKVGRTEVKLGLKFNELK